MKAFTNSKIIAGSILGLAVMCTALPMDTYASLSSNAAGSTATSSNAETVQTESKNPSRLATPSDADDAISKNWEYKKNETGITLTEYLGTDLDVVIPDEIKGVPVTALEDSLFRDKAITSVEMPDTITKIGWNTFWGCKKLEVAELSDSIKELTDSTFYGCESLVEIELPAELEKFDTGIFEGTRLKTLHIPSQVKEIEIDAIFSFPATIEEFTVSPDNEYFSS